MNPQSTHHMSSCSGSLAGQWCYLMFHSDEEEFKDKCTKGEYSEVVVDGV